MKENNESWRHWTLLEIVRHHMVGPVDCLYPAGARKKSQLIFVDIQIEAKKKNCDHPLMTIARAHTLDWMKQTVTNNFLYNIYTSRPKGDDSRILFHSIEWRTKKCSSIERFRMCIYHSTQILTDAHTLSMRSCVYLKSSWTHLDFRFVICIHRCTTFIFHS